MKETDNTPNAGDPATAATGRATRATPVRFTRRTGWTMAKRKAFLDHLAATSNVSHAAAAVGMSVTNAYMLRRRDAAFAEAWRDALEQGYAHIEAQLLARAIGQDADATRGGDPAATPFDPEIAFRILAHRKGGAGSGAPRGPASVKRVTIDEVEASLRRKLDALDKRLGKA